jgi:hypothetical protein
MKRSPVILLVYLLALGPGTMMPAAVSWAMPGDQQPSISASTPPAFALRTDNPTSVAVAAIGPAGISGRQDEPALQGPYCDYEMAGDIPLENNPGGKSCSSLPAAQPRISVEIGRRLGDRNGILGEFDGVQVDYRAFKRLTLKGIAGSPAVAAEGTLESARQVFGISAATDRFARRWDLQGYLIGQRENGRVAGRSVGGVIRSLRPEQSMLVYFDYDVAADSPGTLMAAGAWAFSGKSTLSATLGRQYRPLPDRQARHLEQSMAVTEGWDRALPMERLADYVDDDSHEISVLGVGLTHSLSPRVKLSSDVVLLEAGGGTNTEQLLRSGRFVYHVQLAGKDLILPGDHNSIDLRHAVTEESRSHTASFDAKYALGRSWELIHRLRADYHEPVQGSGSHWAASPNIILEYRRNEQSGLRIKAGGNVSNGEGPAIEDSRPSYYVSLAYQARF